MKLVTLQGIHINKELKSYQASKEMVKEISKYAECEVLHYVTQYDGKIHHENSVCVINYKGIKVTVMKGWRDKYCFYHHINLPWVDQREVNVDHIKKPNEVGVLSQKKVNDWCEYYYQIKQELEVESEKRTSRVDAFNKYLEDHKDQYAIRKHSREPNTGWIYYRDVEIAYNIESTGYISQRVRYTGPTSIQDLIERDKGLHITNKKIC